MRRSHWWVVLVIPLLGVCRNETSSFLASESTFRNREDDLRVQTTSHCEGWPLHGILNPALPILDGFRAGLRLFRRAAGTLRPETALEGCG